MKIIRNTKKSKNMVTLVCCVHGNEVFGKDVFDHFSNKLAEFPGLTVILANERSIKEGRRFIDSDLNRVFPGDSLGDYETRLAARIMEEIDYHSLVIDIHTTTSPLKFTPIITNLSQGTRRIINQCKSAEVVFMKNGKNSLIGQLKSGVSFEYGVSYVKNNRVVPDIESAVKLLLAGKCLTPSPRNIYRCSSTLPKDFNIPIKSENFKPIEGTNIVPFLIFEENYSEYAGFTLEVPKIVNI